MLRLAQYVLKIGLLSALMSCAALPQPRIQPVEVTQPPGFPAQAYAEPVNDRIFRITEAYLDLKTYRAGWLRSAAHNHVMTTTDIQGLVYLADNHVNSFADLYFRPYDLVLDDPESRRAAGEGFESTRTDKDIAATRTRMLGPSGFHSNDHPFVTIHIQPAETAPGRDQATLHINVGGRVHQQRVRVTWSETGNVLQADSSFQLSQKVLGMKPYTAFLGALAVADTVDVRITIKAETLRLMHPVQHGVNPEAQADLIRTPARGDFQPTEVPRREVLRRKVLRREVLK